MSEVVNRLCPSSSSRCRREVILKCIVLQNRNLCINSARSSSGISGVFGTVCICQPFHLYLCNCNSDTCNYSKTFATLVCPQSKDPDYTKSKPE